MPDAGGRLRAGVDHGDEGGGGAADADGSAARQDRREHGHERGARRPGRSEERHAAEADSALDGHVEHRGARARERRADERGERARTAARQDRELVVRADRDLAEVREQQRGQRDLLGRRRRVERRRDDPHRIAVLVHHQRLRAVRRHRGARQQIGARHRQHDGARARRGRAPDVHLLAGGTQERAAVRRHGELTATGLRRKRQRERPSTVRRVEHCDAAPLAHECPPTRGERDRDRLGAARQHAGQREAG